MGVTRVLYNSVEIFNPVTRGWSESSQYDDTGTDVILKRYSLAFEGILHLGALANSPGYISDGTLQPSATALFRQVSAKLWEPRKNLEVWFGGALALSVLSSNPVNQGGAPLYDPARDVDNGPKPKHVKLIQIAGGNVFRVQFEIEAAHTCAANGQVTPILSNRWSVQEAMDRNFFTTRTITGVIRLSSGATPAHAYKGYVVPGLEDGFARESIDYTASADGLSASYTVVDRQVHTAAPWPATRMSGSHTESTGDGTKFYSHCHVRLDGPPNSDKRALISRAIQIVDARLDMMNREDQVGYFIEQAAITDMFGDENAVEVDFKISQTPKDIAVFLTHLKADVIGSPLKLPATPGEPDAYDPRKNPVPSLFGYRSQGGASDTRSPAALFLLHCYLQSPCVNQHAIAQFPQTEETAENGESQQRKETSVSGQTGKVTAHETPQYKEGASENIYTVVRMSTKYTSKPMRVQLPLATPPANASGDTSVVVRFGTGICYREIWYEAERIGQPPQLPKPVDSYVDSQSNGPITCTLIDHNFESCAPTLASNGRSYVHRIEAYFKYGMSRPYIFGEKPRIGALPIFKATMEDTALPGNIFNEDIGP